MNIVTQPPPGFYSINSDNQTELIFAPVYDKNWFQELESKYSWDSFNEYDNRYIEYMYNLFDTLPALAKGKATSDSDFFSKLTRGQKVFYSVLVFGGDTDNGGVYQFFFNRPEFAFAVQETFKELKLERLSKDYEACLDEFITKFESYTKKRSIFNNDKESWEERHEAFQKGYSDLKSGETIQVYFYNKEFKLSLYKTVVDYIDSNLGQFVRK